MQHLRLQHHIRLLRCCPCQPFPPDRSGSCIQTPTGVRRSVCCIVARGVGCAVQRVHTGACRPHGAIVLQVRTGGCKCPSFQRRLTFTRHATRPRLPPSSSLSPKYSEYHNASGAYAASAIQPGPKYSEYHNALRAYASSAIQRVPMRTISCSTAHAACATQPTLDSQYRVTTVPHVVWPRRGRRLMPPACVAEQADRQARPPDR